MNHLVLFNTLSVVGIVLFLLFSSFYLFSLNKKPYKFDYILRELPTCNNPYRSSISRNEYSFACAGLCIGTGGCICDAPVLGGPVVIVLHDSYTERQRRKNKT